MKRTFVVLAIIALIGVFVFPTIFTSNFVYAASNNLIVSQTVEVMYSGHISITDVIRFQGSSAADVNTLPNDFTMGLPNKYAPYILDVKAFNPNSTLPVTRDVPIEGHPEFYGVHIDLTGVAGDSFQVLFILSNSLITQNGDSFQMDYPAYPAFTQVVGTFSEKINLLNTETSISVTKSDGNIDGTSGNRLFLKIDLPAYTNIPALASFVLSTGTLQLTKIPTLDREITVNPSGLINEVDNYRIINSGTQPINTFQLAIPILATDVVVTDQYGRPLTINNGPIKSGSNQRLNVSLTSPLDNGQSIILIAKYNVQTLSEEGSLFKISIDQFPYINYYVDSGTMKLSLPEGASIVAPDAATLNQYGTVTNQGFQKIFTINRQGVTFQDQSIPGLGSLFIAYDYNPIWASTSVTFIAFAGAIVAVIAVLLLKKRQVAEKPLPKISSSKIKTEEATSTGKGTPDKIHDLNEAYEERANVSEEIKALDARVQKNKIPRRQYKIQHQALQNRTVNLNKKIGDLKDSIRTLGPEFADLIRQLDQADENLVDEDENLDTLEEQRSRGEVSNDEYHESLDKFQRKKDKTLGAINGILLRLREKMR
jgi:hypothetical protein